MSESLLPRHSYRDLPAIVRLWAEMPIVEAKMVIRKALGPDWRIGYKNFRNNNYDGVMAPYSGWRPPESIFPTWDEPEWYPGKVVSIPRTKTLCWCKVGFHIWPSGDNTPAFPNHLMVKSYLAAVPTPLSTEGIADHLLPLDPRMQSVPKDKWVGRSLVLFAPVIRDGKITITNG